MQRNENLEEMEIGNKVWARGSHTFFIGEDHRVRDLFLRGFLDVVHLSLYPELALKWKNDQKSETNTPMCIQVPRFVKNVPQ